MSEPHADSPRSLEQRFFGALHRYIPALGRMAARLDERKTASVDGLYWVLALLGTLPALRSGQLWPTSWLAQSSSELALAGSQNIFGWLAPIFALALVVLVATRGKAWRALAILPYVLIATADISAGNAATILNGAYAVSAFVVFLYFVVAGRMRSVYFVVYVIGLLLARDLDTLLTSDRVAAFVTVSIVAGLLYEIWRQNRTMLRELGRENVLALLGRTIALWSPTILLIFAGLAVSRAMLTSAEQLIYDATFVEPYCVIAGGPDDLLFPCPESGNRIEGSAILAVYESPEVPSSDVPIDCYYRPFWNAAFIDGPSPPRPERSDCPPVYPSEDGWAVARVPLEISLDRSVERQLQFTRAQVLWDLSDATGRALGATRTAGTEARNVFSVVPETPGITIERCFLLDLQCHIVVAVKHILIDSYVRIRTQTETAFVNQMQARADAIAAGIEGAATDVEEAVGDAIDAWSNATRDSIAGMYTGYRLISVLMTLWLIVITLKSLLYVFARVAFDRKTKIFADLVDDDTPKIQGRVEHVQEVNIPGDYPFDIYYKSNYQPLGPAPRFAIPQPFASLLSRIRFGAWNLSQVPMPCEDARGLSFNAIQADHLVDWHMQEGEEIVFSYDNFVAMNENVELRTIVSVRVSSLLLGRFVFHAARCKSGPGRLILRTRGRPATADQVRQSIPITRLVAWNSFTRFSVDSHLTRTDVFFNSYNLRRTTSEADGNGDGILIVEADARDGGVLFGTLRFARHFLLPI